MFMLSFGKLLALTPLELASSRGHSTIVLNSIFAAWASFKSPDSSSNSSSSFTLIVWFWIVLWSEDNKLNFSSRCSIIYANSWFDLVFLLIWEMCWIMLGSELFSDETFEIASSLGDTTALIAANNRSRCGWALLNFAVMSVSSSGSSNSWNLRSVCWSVPLPLEQLLNRGLPGNALEFLRNCLFLMNWAYGCSSFEGIVSFSVVIEPGL